VKAGVALYPGDGRDVGTLCTNAEAALKNAKRRGERFLFYAPQMNARVAERLTLENQLRVAMQEEQFILHYQPKIDLATGGLSGLEALLRWANPELGLVSPDRFVPILEETGMILDIGRWALRKAIADHAAWCARGMRPPRIAVNVSVIQLRQEQFVADVRNAVESGGASGRHIDLEITESMIMEDVAGSIQKLSELRALGVGISLDDFGTGYSSQSHIAKLPVNTLKIDRSFIAAMSESSEHMAIVSAVISLARALNMKVVAEGVETQEQSNLLRLLRCDEAQGYLYNPALPPETVERLFVTSPAAAH
jgi:EAL domain-containing protein (putative c-di-GMP-specific phosphodiesterase class I)